MGSSVKLVLVLFGFLLVSGCNESGTSSASDASLSLPLTESVSLSSPIFESSDLATGDVNDPSLTASSDLGSGDGVALPVSLVHNPEPATLLLLGAGLAGVVMFRKKKNKA